MDSFFSNLGIYSERLNSSLELTTDETFRLSTFFLAAEIVVIASVAVYLILFYTYIEVDHPIYAVIYQQLVFLCLAHIVIVLCFFVLGEGNFLLWTRLLFTIMAVTVVFNQASWMVVTILR